MRAKRLYEKPSMKVYELRQQPKLLAGSDPKYNGFGDEQDF